MDILQYYKNDKSISKPKLIKKGGKYTKTFIKYNEKLLRAGTVNNYINPDKIFANGSFIKKKYDKRYKKKVLTQKFKKQYSNIVSGVFKNSLEVKYTFQEGDDQGTLRQIIKENNINGFVKFIFYLDGKHLKSFNLMVSGSPHIWLNDNVEKFSISYDPLIWIWNAGDNVEMVITKETQLTKKSFNQFFRDGNNYYCFYTVILDYFKEKLETAKGTYKKKIQEKLNYIQGKQLKNNYKYGILQKYKGAMPDDENILSTLANKLEVGFDIEMPFQTETFLRIRPLKKVRKVFKYVNSRLNHLEVIEHNGWFNNLYNNDYKKVEYVEREKLYDLIKEAKKKDIMAIYNKDNVGISQVKTTKNFYSISNDYNIVVDDFEKEIGFTPNMLINACLDRDLTNFIIDATHYNGTVDFINCKNINSQDYNIKQIDMKKAYSQFYNCKYYNGFMGIVCGSIRPMTEYKGLKGCFYIYDLYIPDGKLKILNDKMDIYKSHNIYYDTELNFLEDLGASFKIKYGIVGENFDFRFNKDMLENKEIIELGEKKIKVPYYSKWTGQKGSITENKNFYMTGDKKYFQNLRGEHNIYNDGGEEFRVSYPKKSVKHALHISGQITTYQRLGMLEQLLNMDLEKIIRVCVDGIYYYNHNFQPCEKVKFDYDKEKKKFSLWSAGDSFISNMYNRLEADTWKCKNIERKYNRVEFHTGMGGAGKTHYNLVDNGLYNPLFIAPSWFLSEDKKEDYKLKSNSVLARITDIKLPYWKELFDKHNCLICDESSMYSKEQIKFIIENFKGAIMFCGDFKYQLPPIIGDEYEIQKTDIEIKHNKCYRVLDEKFLKLLKKIRKLIDIQNDGEIIYDYNFIYNEFQNISYEELQKIYKVEDMIITSQNNYIQEINKDIDYEKYLITNNTTLYKNGKILYEEPKIKGVEYYKTNAFTIHKIQGKTADTKLFIDKRKMKSLRMLYTAISRARVQKQIYFF